MPPAASTPSLGGHAGKPRAVQQRPLPGAGCSAPGRPCVVFWEGLGPGPRGNQGRFRPGLAHSGQLMAGQRRNNRGSFSKITGRAGRRSLLLGRTLGLERVDDLPKVTQHVWYNRDRDPDVLWNLSGVQTSWFLQPLELASWALGKSRGQREFGSRPVGTDSWATLGGTSTLPQGLGPASVHMTSKGPFRAQCGAAFGASQRLTRGANSGRG